MLYCLTWLELRDALLYTFFTSLPVRVNAIAHVVCSCVSAA